MPSSLLPCLYRSSHSRLTLSTCVPTVLNTHSTGISTCCPSATSFDLALGPDLPRADQLYPGNLGYSAGRIPTFLSLLIPAFSLLNSPQLLPVLLLRVNNASSVGLRILSSSTCVGLRYGHMVRYSGFSWQPESDASLLLFGPRHVFGLLCGFANITPTPLVRRSVPRSSYPSASPQF